MNRKQVSEDGSLDRPRLRSVTAEQELRSLCESTDRLIALAAPIVAREKRRLASRLFAAWMLTDRVEIAEALLTRVAVPVDRLDADWTKRLGWE